MQRILNRIFFSIGLGFSIALLFYLLSAFTANDFAREGPSNGISETFFHISQYPYLILENIEHPDKNEFILFFGISAQYISTVINGIIIFVACSVISPSIRKKNEKE